MKELWILLIFVSTTVMGQDRKIAPIVEEFCVQFDQKKITSYKEAMIQGKEIAEELNIKYKKTIDELKQSYLNKNHNATIEDANEYYQEQFTIAMIDCCDTYTNLLKQQLPKEKNTSACVKEIASNLYFTIKKLKREDTSSVQHYIDNALRKECLKYKEAIEEQYNDGIADIRFQQELYIHLLWTYPRYFKSVVINQTLLVLDQMG